MFIKEADYHRFIEFFNGNVVQSHRPFQMRESRHVLQFLPPIGT
ncbi:hypothetical protein [Candidatus Methylobacter favarea]|nr:hypothetical protein [Candidatus Methylobacter favarea]